MVSGKRIFVAEDEVLIAMLLEDMLDELGCKVAASAHSVDTALESLSASEPIDAAILDIELANEKSWPIAAALAKRAVPFAFSTGHGTSAEIDPRFSDAPVLGKPFDSANLREILSQLLGSR